ncbi:unnamed protein product [Calypogeia fissa]
MEEKGLQRVAHLARHLSRSGYNSKQEHVRRIESTKPAEWRPCSSVGTANEFEEILYEKAEGIAKVTINRPESLNAFTAKTVEELQLAFTDARDDTEIGVVILTGKGSKAFCSGGLVAVRSNSGRVEGVLREYPKLTILDLQMQIRRLSQPVIAMVAGYAVGAGNVLQLVCDLTVAADNAVFGCTQTKIGSFDAGYGVSTMVHMIGARKTRELCFLARLYDAQEALSMGLVNAVVPLDKLEQETVRWCREILSNSSTTIRVLKAAINATEGSSDQQALTSNLSMYFYASDEAEEGRRAFLEGRRPDFSKFK